MMRWSICALLPLAGCYCSHVRSDPMGPDAGHDGAVADTTRDAGADACASDVIVGFGCGAPELLDTAVLDVVGRYEILDVVDRGTVVGVLLGSAAHAGPLYRIVELDTASRRVRTQLLEGYPAPVGDTRPQYVSGAVLTATDEGWDMVAVTARAEGDGSTGRTISLSVLSAHWDTDSLMTSWRESDPFATGVPICRGCRATAFGLGDESVAALAFNGRIETARLPAGAPGDPEVAQLRPLPDEHPGHTPISAAALPSNDWVFVGGGAAAGSEPREGFVLMRAPDGTVRSAMLPGRAFDAPPLVALGPEDGFTAFRYVIDESDALQSGLHVIGFDRLGAVEREIIVPSHGAPAPLSTFAGSSSAGPFAVWSEPVPDTTEDIIVRLLPQTPHETCGTVEVPPALRVPNAAATPSVGAVLLADAWYIFALPYGVRTLDAQEIAAFRVVGCEPRFAP